MSPCNIKQRGGGGGGELGGEGGTGGLKQTLESGKFALPIPTSSYLINKPLK